MIYFAHRGASAHAPANSLPAFALAREAGCTHYELDVHLSKDGYLIVHHDYFLGTDTSCDKEIKKATLDDIRHCRIIHSFNKDIIVSPPLLREVFPVIIEELELLNIEIKNDDGVYPDIEEILWKRVSLHGPEAVKKMLFSSFDYPTLQRLRKIAPAAQIGLLMREFDPQKAHNINAYSVHINKTRITKEIVDICHAEGRKVFVYTVNDQYTAHLLERLGVDGIFTDDPALFLIQRKTLPKALREKYAPLKLSRTTRLPLR